MGAAMKHQDSPEIVAKRQELSMLRAARGRQPIDWEALLSPEQKVQLQLFRLKRDAGRLGARGDGGLPSCFGRVE
jgi:hypothetical protein